MLKIMAEYVMTLAGVQARISCDDKGWAYLYLNTSNVKNRFIFASKIKHNNGEETEMKRLIKAIKKGAKSPIFVGLVKQLAEEHIRKEKELEEALKESKDISG